MRVFRFIHAEKASFPVAFMCPRLGVSRSGYYAWARRPPSARAVRDAELTTAIVRIHEASRRTYGSPRIHAELRYEGQRVGRKRVARLMRTAGVQGICVRRPYRTTHRVRGIAPAPDLVDRRFTTDRPNRLWVADITYVPTGEGFLHPGRGPGLLQPGVCGVGHGAPPPDGAGR